MAEPCTNDDASHSLAESLRGLALDDPERDKRLMQIGYAQLDLYDTESSNPDHLLKAIALFREALVLRPVGHAYRSAALNILGVTLHMRFDRTGDMADLQEAITCHAEARQIRKPNNAARPDSCSNLGLAYHALFSQTGDRDALQKSIEMHREAFDLSSPQDPSHGNHRGNLATALMTRYNQDEDMPTLREVIDLHRQTLQLYEPGDPRSAYSMQNLAVALEALYVHDADLSTAEEAIRLYREALVFVPPGHPNRAGLLTTLSAALGSLFEQTGDLSALEEALESSREALRLAPEHSPGRLACLNNVALLALTLFRRTGRVNALDETIELNRTVLASRPSGHPKRSSTLDVLAVALTFRFQVTGGLAALAESIQLLRENVQTCPPAMRDAALHSLAGALLIRYAEDPEADDIEEIVRLNRETLLLRPAGSLLHPYSLHSLADALTRRYSQNGDPKDMQEAIALLQQALSLRPAAHPERPLVLDQLAMTSRQIINASADDLRRAIALYEEALQLLPGDHPDRAVYVSSLGETLLKLFEKTDDLEVLNSAIAQLQLAASLRVPGHPQYVDYLLKLVKALAARLQVRLSADSAMQMQTIDSSDWHRCLEFMSVAAVDESVPAGQRVRQAIGSLSVLHRCLAVITREKDAEAIRLLDVMLAYVRLLPRVANFGLTRSKRLRALSRAGTLTRMTAAVALVLGQTQVTLEVLEEGRGVFWTQALLLRSQILDELPDTDRSKLEEIFTALEKEPAPSHQGMIADGADETVVAESQAERRRESNEMAEALLRSIRARPGFQRFLMPPAFIQLVRVAQQGPVVVLLVTDRDGSALIIPGFSAEPKVVSLPLLKPNELQSMRADVPEGRLLEPVETGDDEPTRLQLGRSKKMGKFERALSRLWAGVVRPIVDALELQIVEERERPRVTWCLTGSTTFLPIHAAGVYEGSNLANATQYMVSSYTPSLSVILKARDHWTPIPRQELRALLVAESAAPGLPILDGVHEEVQAVAGILTSVSATVVRDSPTVGVTLRHLPATHLLHLASHGQQREDPLTSCFALQDGGLTIKALMDVRLQNPTLAFLSACETAKGAVEHPDEAVHLAASMMFCGFRSVIATMWSMSDVDGPQIARWFYEALMEQEQLDLGHIPYALDRAVRRLRETGVPASRWSSFVHFGA